MHDGNQSPDATPAAGLRPWRLVSRLLHVYWRFSRGMTLGVRAVVLNEAGHVFLVRHSYTPGWHLPGGGVEPGETLEGALAKELMEEGLIRMSEPPSLHGVFYHPAASRRDHVAVYLVRRPVVLGARLPDREIVEARFFALDALPADTTAGTRRRIEELCKGQAPGPVW